VPQTVFFRHIAKQVERVDDHSFKADGALTITLNGCGLMTVRKQHFGVEVLAPILMNNGRGTVKETIEW
jgi:hypothetical protein